MPIKVLIELVGLYYHSMMLFRVLIVREYHYLGRLMLFVFVRRVRVMLSLMMLIGLQIVLILYLSEIIPNEKLLKYKDSGGYFLQSLAMKLR